MIQLYLVLLPEIMEYLIDKYKYKHKKIIISGL